MQNYLLKTQSQVFFSFKLRKFNLNSLPIENMWKVALYHMLFRIFPPTTILKKKTTEFRNLKELLSRKKVKYAMMVKYKWTLFLLFHSSTSRILEVCLIFLVTVTLLERALLELLKYLPNSHLTKSKIFFFNLDIFCLFVCP